MPSITIRMQFSETRTVAQLFKFCGEYYPGEQMIQADQAGYVLELDDGRSTDLLDYLEMIPELPGFEPYKTERATKRNQFELPIHERPLSEEKFRELVA